MDASAELTLRPMTEDDLPTFESWLHEPHFGRWFLQDATIEEELADNRNAIRGDDPAVVLIVELDGRSIGWCQWYSWWDYPTEAAEYDAAPAELGIDYGIGDPLLVGRGVGSQLIATLVERVREARPAASILSGPSAANRASCAVLEKNGFVLVDTRDIPSEPNASPIALYRLAPAAMG